MALIRSNLQKACAVSAGMAAMSLLVGAYFAFGGAYAEEIDTDPQPDELQQEVERTAAAYQEALDQVAVAEQALVENRDRITELEEAIPLQQARSDAAARELYKIEQQSGGVLELLLGSDSFFDFITNLEYVSRATDANVAEINSLSAMKTELDQTQSALRQAKRDADKHAEEANDALSAAKEARLEAQRRAQEEAEAQAAAEAAAQAQAEAEAEAAAEAAAAAAAQSQDDASAQEASSKAPSAAGADETQTPASNDNETPVAQPTVDNADWTADQSAFIAEWAPRIDAYLTGSPLAGQGVTFASAAWTYGVDPRWSPAISFTESTKGAACFAPHNAWGWGSESWDTWEEAINDHVRGLARGYGYTISVEAAQKYCPPNWEAWYNRTLEQMNLI